MNKTTGRAAASFAPARMSLYAFAVAGALPTGCFLRDDFYIEERPVGLETALPVDSADASAPHSGTSTVVGPKPTDVVEETDGVVIGGDPSTHVEPETESEVNEPPMFDPPGTASSVPAPEPSVAFDAGRELPPTLNDSGGPDVSTPEAGIEPSPCRSFSSWGDPERITGLGLATLHLWSPSVSAEGLEMVFAASDSNDEQLYVARRATSKSPFGLATPLTELNSVELDGTPALSADGLSIVFFSERDSDNRDLWLATRSREDAAFDPPTRLDELNTDYDDHLPWLSDDGLTLLYVSEAPTDEGFDSSNIWIAIRTDVSEPFIAGMPLGGINSDGYDDRAAFSSGGLAIYFSSDREQGGSFDLFVATRPDSDSDFGAAAVVTTQSSEAGEADVTLSRDNLEILYASDREGRFALFHAWRSCLE